MGTITARKRKNGSVSYMARVRVMRDGATYHQTETFDRRPAAVAWMKKRERELAKPGAISGAIAVDPTLAKAIDRYTEESIKDIGRTKTQVLKTIKNYDIANMPCSTIRSKDIVAFLQSLTAKPQTVGNYASHLAAIFAIARPMWDYRFDEQEMKDAGQGRDSADVEIEAPAADETSDKETLAAIQSRMETKHSYRDPDLNLDRLARRALIPARQISTAINRATGKNVSQYVNELRIAEACQLLAETEKSVTEVMLDVGFQTKSNFNRELRRVTDMTPVQWRSSRANPG